MPYSGAGDPGLPANVKKMPENKRKQWVAIFNSSLARCQQGKLPPPPGGAGGKPPTCEGRAFAIANGTVKSVGKEVGLHMEIDDETVALKEEIAGAEKGEECVEVGASIGVIYDAPPPPPYGGATSFDGISAYLEARKLEWALGDLWRGFKVILENIERADADEMDATAKIKAVQAAANDLAKLMAKPEEAATKLGFREKVASAAGTAWSRIQQAMAGPNGGHDNVLGPHRTLAGTKGQGGFFSFKDAKGVWRWVAVFSNKFKDRDGETLAEAAHLKYVAKADELGKYPELRLWHVPGSRVGYAEMVDYVDGFMLSAGRFDPGMEPAAARLAELADDLGISHGFLYPVWAKKDGVVWEYWTFELSPLPRSKEANEWTVFGAEATAKGVGDMPMAPEKRAFLVDVIGEEKTAAVEESLATFSKDLEEHGIDWKEVGQAFMEPPWTPASDSQPVVEAEPAAVEAAPAEVPAPDKEKEDEPEGPTLQELSSKVDALGSHFEGMNTTLGEIAAAVKDLQRSDDEKVAAAMAPRRREPDPSARATGSPENVVDDDKAAAIVASGGEPDPNAPVNPVMPYIEQLKGVTPLRS